MLPAGPTSGSQLGTSDSSLRTLKNTLLANLILNFFVNLTLVATPLYMMRIYNRMLPSPSWS